MNGKAGRKWRNKKTGENKWNNMKRENKIIEEEERENRDLYQMICLSLQLKDDIYNESKWILTSLLSFRLFSFSSATSYVWRSLFLIAANWFCVVVYSFANLVFSSSDNLSASFKKKNVTPIFKKGTRFFRRSLQVHQFVNSSRF